MSICKGTQGVVTALVMVWLAVTAVAADPSGGQEWHVLTSTPDAGEICIVCGKSMTGINDESIGYLGRVIAVCGRCGEKWAADPDRYFRKVQARAALFDEEAMRGGPISTGWLFFGVYMLTGTIVGGFCAYVAVGRGLSPLPWFFGGVVGNVVTLGLLLTRASDTTGLPQGVPRGLRKVPVTFAPRYCPECGMEHHPSATTCPACGCSMTPSVEAETKRV